MKRLLPLLVSAALVLFFGAACGSRHISGANARTPTARSEAKLGGEQLLTLALAEATRTGDVNPSMVGFTSSGNSFSVLVGVHRPCPAAADCVWTAPVILRASVDAKTKRALALQSVPPPAVTGANEHERALMRQLALGVGIDSRTSIWLRKARWIPRAHRHGISVVYRGGPETTASNWCEQVAAGLLKRVSGVPVNSYVNSGREGWTTGRERVWWPGRVHPPFAFSLPRGIRTLRNMIAATERAGARITSLSFSRSVDTVMSVTIETNSPARFLKHGLAAVLNADWKAKPRFSADTINIVDRHGNPIFDTGGLSNYVRKNSEVVAGEGEGFQGFAPTYSSLEYCLPDELGHSGPGGIGSHKPPPCPVR